MHRLRQIAAAAAMLGGALLASGSASAAPIPPAGIEAAQASTPLVESVQYYGYGPRPFYGPPPFYGPRRFYHPRPYYRRRPFYGPPVVCRFRPTPFGPRRVCFRRY